MTLAILDFVRNVRSLNNVTTSTEKIASTATAESAATTTKIESAKTTTISPPIQ